MIHYVGEIIVDDHGIHKVIDIDENGIYTAETIIPKSAFIEAFEKYIYNPTVITCNPLSDEETEKLINTIQNQSLRCVETPHEIPTFNRSEGRCGMSEVRLIDADALKKAITLNRNIDRNAVCDVLDIIDNAPTVEERSYAMGYQDGAEDGLQDIRTPGKWELHGKRYYCSECGEEAINIESEPDMYSSNYCLTNYCPNCGADMRGKKND